MSGLPFHTERTRRGSRLSVRCLTGGSQPGTSPAPKVRDAAIVGLSASSLGTTIRNAAFFKIESSWPTFSRPKRVLWAQQFETLLFSKLRVRGPRFPARACKRASGTHRTRRSPAWRRVRNRCQPGKAQAGWRIPRARKCCCSCRPQCAWGLCLELRPGFWSIQQCL